jgi:hypothetical protein
MQTFSDFISKNFDFGHSVKAINKSSGGIKIENSVSPSGGKFKSYTKANFPVCPYGKAEVQITANGAPKDTKAKFECAKIAGAEVTISATSEPNVTVEASYSPVKNISTKLEFSTDLDAKKGLKASVNASSNGCKATVDSEFCLAAGALKDVNVKLDYKQDKLLAQAKTAKGRTEFTAWVAQQYCKGFYWGAQVNHNLKAGSTQVTLGSRFNLDDNTTVFKKLDSDGKLACSIEQKLSNPAVKVNAATQFNLLGSSMFAAEKFGVGFTLGDY